MMLPGRRHIVDPGELPGRRIEQLGHRGRLKDAIVPAQHQHIAVG
jgi:hypothetical protein